MVNRPILFLDDNAERASAFLRLYPHAVWVMTAEDTIEKLRSGNWYMVSLDHDLGGDAFINSSREDCGMEVVRALVDGRLDLARLVETRFIVHSWNMPAAKEMALKLQEAGYWVRYQPFSLSMRSRDGK